MPGVILPSLQHQLNDAFERVINIINVLKMRWCDRLTNPVERKRKRTNCLASPLNCKANTDMGFGVVGK